MASQFMPDFRMHPTNSSMNRSPTSSRPGISGVLTALSPTHSSLPSVEAARLASLRLSTPDSETLFSSDDEHELARSVHSLTGSATGNPKPPKQPTVSMEGSWLSEIHSGPPRRPSAATTTSNVSQPPTPSEAVLDPHGWPFQNPLGRVSSHPMTTSWNNVSSPWSSAVRSPGEDRQQAAIPSQFPGAYSIPLQPVPKTYRSQSYSVGQMESEHNSPAASGSNIEQSRRTPSQVPHRPSRPSMLSEVFEGDDPTRAQGYETEVFIPGSATSPIGSEGRRENVVESAHNPLLRQATKVRARHSQSTSTSDACSPTGFHSAYHSTSVPPASEAVMDEGSEHYSTAGLSRRFSELAGLGVSGDSGRRGQWQTSLGFGTLQEIPQSRRHSMADMPTRRNSIIGVSDQVGVADQAHFASNDSQGPTSLGEPYQNGMAQTHDRDMQNRSYAHSYFSGIGPALRSRIESSQSPVSIGMHNLSYQSSPPQGIFSRPGQETPLYIVSFKCARAETYYVADNTGLSVKAGDLVIVEADRGHDLGTVLHAKVSWAQAREYKQKANEEHYRWLMMFSRHNKASEGATNAGTGGTGGTGGMMAGSAPDRPQNGIQTGGMVFNPSMINQKTRETDLKPKMIKRLAQPHEIATLRDKEGNEAKAKRICSQKVNEMKLDMEILDAEFQTDWKKLTFFYYAFSYVNFNVLVTDLFKVYKTRIWMSAVNPESLNGPLPPPRGLGPGVISGRDSVLGHRSNGSRSGFPSISYSGESYAPTGGYQGMGGSIAYGYTEEQESASSNQAHTTAQQSYDFMAGYNNGQASMGGLSYNTPMQKYGWSGYNGGYNGWQAGPRTAHMGFASGLGMPQSRDGPHDQTGGYGSSARPVISPISPPGAQAQRAHH